METKVDITNHQAELIGRAMGKAIIEEILDAFNNQHTTRAELLVRTLGTSIGKNITINNDI